MPPSSEELLLSLLPERVRSYRDAFAINDLQSEEHCRIELCSLVERLLELHLAGCKGCDSISMVDGVLPATFEVSDSGIVSIVGLAVWTGHGGWFLDPFAARIELSPDRKSVRAYSLSFGDAEAGLGKFPYEPYSTKGYRPPPHVWLFVFGRGGVRQE